jgi:probable phosphoglycerate mutase
MALTTVYAARHGETALNAEERVCGAVDLPLTDNGLAQAHELADLLADKGIERIYCSDMARARQTAAVVGERLGVTPVADARLREMCFGALEGCPRDDAEFNRRKQVFAERFPGGGESILQGAHRVYAFLDDMLTECRGQTVLIVSHGWTNKLIASYFGNLSNEAFAAFRLLNCGYAQYTCEAEES